MHNRPLAFSMGSGRKAVFRCAHCSAFVEINLAGRETINPELAAKKAVQKGWIANPFNPTRNCCPKCQGPKRKNDPNSELKGFIPMAVTPIKASIEVREPTPDQRMRIRGHLDKSFDDGVGTYLDDMSDERIAELVGVPRIIVERMREAAYGPIRVTPEAIQLRSDLAAWRTEVEDQQKGIDNLKAKGATLASRLEQMLVGKAS